ncbi:hypothetical protein Tdes44962_MAKER08144 [Teratosphaeria destructans]|uniref:Uncharacterized protein n=1 Tax=Teratosphaeria destructans TaxID=418781 RepID=A0A9W7SX75_9PEZI|nr:hypothetical protein Tdes44962_MAKER08144 [Teratosphaeria destructans]
MAGTFDFSAQPAGSETFIFTANGSNVKPHPDTDEQLHISSSLLPVCDRSLDPARRAATAFTPAHSPATSIYRRIYVPSRLRPRRRVSMAGDGIPGPGRWLRMPGSQSPRRRPGKRWTCCTSFDT